MAEQNWETSSRGNRICERQERGIKENDGGSNSTMTYYKNFCKCHNVFPVQ
jgi:hypothetical protein